MGSAGLGSSRHTHPVASGQLSLGSAAHLNSSYSRSRDEIPTSVFQCTHPRTACTCVIRITELRLDKPCGFQHWDGLPKEVQGNPGPKKGWGILALKRSGGGGAQRWAYCWTWHRGVGFDLGGFSSLNNSDSVILPSWLLPAILGCCGIPALISALHVFSSSPSSPACLLFLFPLGDVFSPQPFNFPFIFLSHISESFCQ